jgi:imidazolonepropionase-like amidohydrolase
MRERSGDTRKALSGHGLRSSGRSALTIFCTVAKSFKRHLSAVAVIAVIAVIAVSGFWLFVSPVMAADQQDGHFTIVHAGTVLAVPGTKPLQNQSIFIRNGRITELRSGFAVEDDAQIIDLRNAFVLPGLIDLHVHLTSAPEPGGELDDVVKTSADLALAGAVHAERLLQAGFTTILDLGTGMREHEEAVFALRDAIAKGILPGPRILAVGSPISIPGQSRTARFRREVDAVAGADNVCSGVENCRSVVREQIKRGADVINFYNSGSLLSSPSVPITFTEDEMRAIVSTAHSLGRPVVADGGNTRGDASGINTALRVGVDSIDTVTYPDDETWRLLKANNAYFVPHLYAVDAAVGDTAQTLEQGSMGWLPRPILEFLWRLKQEPPSAIDGYKAGVKFAFGSDPGVFHHGLNGREFAHLTRIGMTAQEAIVTATVAAASMLRKENEIGTIEVGKWADLIATSGDPLKNIRELERVKFVTRLGVIYKNDFEGED